jgi:hypothetical protein
MGTIAARDQYFSACCALLAVHIGVLDIKSQYSSLV